MRRAIEILEQLIRTKMKNSFTSHKHQARFTLTEFLVLLVVIVILALIVCPAQAIEGPQKQGIWGANGQVQLGHDSIKSTLLLSDTLKTGLANSLVDIRWPGCGYRHSSPEKWDGPSVSVPNGLQHQVGNVPLRLYRVGSGVPFIFEPHDFQFKPFPGQQCSGLGES